MTISEKIAVAKYDEYKGRAPFDRLGPNRANPHMEGESDGAYDCAAAVRALGE